MQINIIFLFIFEYGKMCKPINIRHKIWKSRDLRSIHRIIPQIFSYSRTHQNNNEVTKKSIQITSSWKVEPTWKLWTFGFFDIGVARWMMHNLLVPDRCSPSTIRSDLCRSFPGKIFLFASLETAPVCYHSTRSLRLRKSPNRGNHSPIF